MTNTTHTLPFDQQRLDDAMAAAGIDVLLASSSHNVRYLLGGYRHHYYVNDQALGLDHYEPVVGYVLGRPGDTFLVTSWMDADPLALQALWVPDQHPGSTGGPVTAALVADALQARGLSAATVGIEAPFLSVGVHGPLAEALPRVRFADAVPVLERLRAVKAPAEIGLMREASEGVVAAMAAVFDRAREGDAATDLERWMGEEQRRRGLEFSFSFVGLGADPNRTPTARQLERGMTVNLDSAGKVGGFVGDLARMAVVGGPTDAQVAALAAVDTIQQAARASICAGALGCVVYDDADAAIAALSLPGAIDFVAHGIGMVSHEAPRLAPPNGNPHGYPSPHRELPLEEGMVLSIETTYVDAAVGYVKLEDTVAVGREGCEGLGDGARGWNTIEASDLWRNVA